MPLPYGHKMGCRTELAAGKALAPLGSQPGIQAAALPSSHPAPDTGYTVMQGSPVTHIAD